MRFLRVPNVKKMLAAQFSVKRILRQLPGAKTERGMGIATDTKKALYNRIYNRTRI